MSLVTCWSSMVDAKSADPPVQTYGDIVVIGGGCYGSYYVRQLGRAAEAGALRWSRVLVVDRDAQCLVARMIADTKPSALPAAQMVVAEWGEFLDGWIPVAESGAADAIVPSPLMPHLFYEYLARRAMALWPGRAVTREHLRAPVGTPWESAAPDGTSYVSHATWTCPINCIEPHICPHTRDVRNWTMPATLDAWVRERGRNSDDMLGPFTFHCTHRAYGVGMVDKRAIRDAELAITAAGSMGPVRALISTASHCHGAVAVLSVEKRTERNGERETGSEGTKERGT